ILGEVLVPAGMLGCAALGRDDHVAVAVLCVDQRRRARLARLAAGRREQQDRRSLTPDVADLTAGLAVPPDVLVPEQVLCFAHRSLLLVETRRYASPMDAPQYCYRHPDRETGLSCSECGRPICY